MRSWLLQFWEWCWCACCGWIREQSIYLWGFLNIAQLFFQFTLTAFSPIILFFSAWAYKKINEVRIGVFPYLKNEAVSLDNLKNPSKIYYSMTFSIFIPTPQPLITILLYTSMNLTFLDSTYKWDCVVFVCAWLILFSIMLSSFIGR